MKKVMLLTVMTLLLGGCTTMTNMRCSGGFEVEELSVFVGVTRISFSETFTSRSCGPTMSLDTPPFSSPPVSYLPGGGVTVPVAAGAVAAGVIATALDSGKGSGTTTTTGSVAP